MAEGSIDGQTTRYIVKVAEVGENSVRKLLYGKDLIAGRLDMDKV
jgi:hypothetical protein